MKPIQESDKRSNEPTPVSNVAAIFDIINQRRALLAQSSDDDEDDENEWD